MTTQTIKPPFPWFGGKSRAADIIWNRFGCVPNYVEPFAGSLAVLLARPHEPGTETVNDLDCYLANFWRAVSIDADAVADAANWQVNEADLHARHRWLVSRTEFRERMKTDPIYSDPKIAGWWVWGLCSWIGSGWCAQRRNGNVPEQLPHLGDAGMGIHRKLPHLGDAGRDRFIDYFLSLQARLRGVRVACGEWDRVLGESVTVKHGLTAVLLDPPYAEDGHSITYAFGVGGVSASVWQWARENGENPLLRIALCGYSGAYDLPGWICVPWKAKGGYGSQGDNDGVGRENSSMERIWFSPHCINPELQLL